MTHWDDLRRRARACRAEALGPCRSTEPLAASRVLDAADAFTGLTRMPAAPGDALLDGADATLNRDWQAIVYSSAVEPRLARFYQAHEYAHYWLHVEKPACQELDPEATEEPIPLGVERVEGYGPLERREREANVFAREFLLPTDMLRAWYEAGWNAARLAEQVGLPEGMVVQQLARALLTPDLLEPTRDVSPSEHALDPTQLAAASVEHGPLLVKAGPGTGKTRTLVGRMSVLLGRSVPPGSILALTFSNRAAEEMRARVAEVHGEAAQQMWMGTFHAFGLELLRKYGTRIGLPPRPDVLDPVDAVGLLERGLSELHLDYYENLWDPTLHLRDILAAISRAKDELVDPERYRELAEDMRPTDPEAADKALEVARAYAYYQAQLDRFHLLDFGDLIFKAVRLLQTHPDVRGEVQRTYPQVLVDEYQDVNRASGVFLKEIAGPGDGLWVVGDERQAIYRFRGASPANMRLFASDFPGAVIQTLGRNYRSQPSIVEAFSAFAPHMRATAGQVFDGWEPVRAAEGGEVVFQVADTDRAEAEAIAREIQRRQADGIALRDQAVLCRSHTGVARIAAALEKAGVPVLYLGDVFERPEVRDLLALLQLACEPDGKALLRVARFAEYDVCLKDVQTLLRAAREQNVQFPHALSLASTLDAISDQGRHGLELLNSHLDGLCYGTQPWRLLTQYLFVRSAYLRNLLADSDSVDAQQRRLAIYQFLQFIHDERFPDTTDDEPDPKRRLLRYVRQLEHYGEEKQLRQVPAWAETIDAVRLLTIHASKGLEFRVVYLPGLATGYFPARKQSRPCPPPTGMLAATTDEHEEEEECLFFVGMSRARDVLVLSRAERYGKQNSRPSSLLQGIEAVLPPAGAPAPSATPTPDDRPDPGRAPLPFDARQLDVYLRCPRQYYYEFQLGLGGRREDSAYVQFHVCVYQVLRWLREHDASVATALAKLDEVWRQRGPTDHPYAEVYRQRAENMVARWANRRSRARDAAEWSVDLPHGQVTFVPDQVEQQEDGTEIVERLRTGRPTKSELDKDIYALYHQAAGPARTVQVRYLSNDHVEPVTLKPRSIQSKLAHYDAAIVGILREDFPPTPKDERICARCPFFFICPAGEHQAI